MTYSTAIKAARMTVVRDGVNSGTLELLSAAAAIMCSFPMSAVSGAVVGDLLTFAGFPKANATTIGSNWAAMVSSARLRSSASVDVKTALTVGLTSIAAPPWVAATPYAAVDITRSNGTEQYRVVTPGTSALSGGPTGQGAAIVDGTVTWAWVAKANADVQLATLQWAAGDTLTVQVNPTIQHAP
jgi:hypothetical protein